MAPNRHLRAAGAAVVLLTLLARVPCQEKDENEPAPPTWPQLSKQEAETAAKWIPLLGSEKAETRAKAEEQLMMLPIGVCDRLLKKMKDGENRNINTQLVAILDQRLLPEHAPLIALHARHKSTAGRRYVAKKLAAFGAASTAKALKAGMKDKDVEVAYYSALGLARVSRDEAALDAVFARCVDNWDELGDEVGRFWRDCRHGDYLPWLRKKLQSKPIMETVTALRFMRYLAPQEAASVVRPFLSRTDVILKQEAINALRVMVDGDEPIPLKKLTSFRVISLAKKWQARI